MKKDQQKIIVLFFLIGLAIWAVDFIFDSFIFSHTNFPSPNVFRVGLENFYLRDKLVSFLFKPMLMVVIFTTLGFIISRFASNQKKSEADLRNALLRIEEEKRKTEAILEAIGDGISIQSPDYRVIYQNRMHKEAIGSHQGEYCYKAYHKRDEICPDCPVQMTFQDGEMHTVEETGRTPEGEPLYVEVTASPLTDASGRIIAGIEAVRYIGERKKAEQEKEHLIAELKKALSEIKTLRGLIPVCAWCKKVRNDKGYWESVEEYIQKNSNARVTHGICSDCLNKAYEEERKRNSSS